MAIRITKPNNEFLKALADAGVLPADMVPQPKPTAGPKAQRRTRRTTAKSYPPRSPRSAPSDSNALWGGVKILAVLLLGWCLVSSCNSAMQIRSHHQPYRTAR